MPIKANREWGNHECEPLKTLTEPLLCYILGLSGLTWGDDQDLLADLATNLTTDGQDCERPCAPDVLPGPGETAPGVQTVQE